MDDDIIMFTTDPDAGSSPQKRQRTARGRATVSEGSSPQKENASSVAGIEQTKAASQTTAVGQLRKTARRGLARKLPPDLAASTSCDFPKLSTTHKKASVYSSCVGHGFQSIYGNQSTNYSQSVHSVSKDQSQEKNLEIEGRLGGDEELSDCAVTSGDDSTSTSSPNQVSTNDEEPEGGNSIAAASLRSPTPPPELQSTKKHYMSRRLQKALKKLNTAKARLDKQNLTLSPQRGRLRNRRAHADSSIILLADSPAPKADMVVKVRHLSSVHRFQLNLTQPFHVLLTKISQELSKEEHNLSLFLHDSSLSLNSTPQNVNLSVADIIECYDMTDAGDDFLKAESVSVTIQCSNSKKKTSMEAYTRMPLQDLMERYAKRFDLNIGSFRFCFDGEDVRPTETPLKLDMEDGDVLDVVPHKDTEKELAYTRGTQVITLI